jgi:hypothetical protein
MNLRFSSLKGFAEVFKRDFLGQQGFLLPHLPRKKQIRLGVEMEIDIDVEGDSWGRIRAVAVWKNIFGAIDENTPRGVFLRIVKAEPLFESKVGGMLG